jgi:hypothetical protein
MWRIRLYLLNLGIIYLSGDIFLEAIGVVEICKTTDGANGVTRRRAVKLGKQATCGRLLKPETLSSLSFPKTRISELVLDIVEDDL